MEFFSTTVVQGVRCCCFCNYMKASLECQRDEEGAKQQLSGDNWNRNHIGELWTSPASLTSVHKNTALPTAAYNELIPCQQL